MFDDFGYDPEAVIQDADILQAQWEDEGRRIARLEKAGICVHGWTQGFGPVKCLYCGKTWETFEEHDREVKDLLS